MNSEITTHRTSADPVHCRAIAGSGADENTKDDLYRRVWEATENLESPHDEWSQDVFYGITGLWFGEDG